MQNAKKCWEVLRNAEKYLEILKNAEKYQNHIKMPSKTGAYLEEPLDECSYSFLARVGFYRFEQQVEKHHLL